MSSSLIHGILGCTTGLVALILVTQWAQHDPLNSGAFLGLPTNLVGDHDTNNWVKSGNNVFAWHPVLLVGGFFFTQVCAVNTWTIIPDASVQKYLRFFWQTLAFTCMISGLVAVAKFNLHNKNGMNMPEYSWAWGYTPSLTTMHSWIGVIGVIMFGFTYLVDIVSTFVPDFKQPFLQESLALGSIIASSCAIIAGIQTFLGTTTCYYVTSTPFKDQNPASSFGKIPQGCRIANGMGIAAAIAAILTVMAVVIKNKQAKSHEAVVEQEE